MREETFDRVWDEVILPAFERCKKELPGLICPEYEKKNIYIYYQELDALAKNHYMAEDTEQINRHKVAAAMMIAILKAKPIKKVSRLFYDTTDDGRTRLWAINESLSVTVALSILGAYILRRVDVAFSGAKVPKAIFGEVCEQDLEIFRDGVIPITAEERRSWEWELYQIRLDGAYNLLSMAHILCDIETMARMKYFLEHKDQTPKHSPYLTDEQGRVIGDVDIDEIVSYKKPK